MKKQEGLRYNEGKLRLDLITPQIIKGIGDVLTKGAEKYADRNWELGMSWSKVIASLKRHLLAIEKGEDYDKETGLLHVRIRNDINKTPTCWYYSYKFNSNLWEELKKDKDFWLNIEPYSPGEELPFEPTCYVTHRPIPKEWCEEWLEKHNFPSVPVYIVGGSKVDVLRKLNEEGKVDWFVDDKYTNFTELNKAGIFTYLLDQPWNRRHDVGHRRIYSLKELVK